MSPRAGLLAALAFLFLAVLLALGVGRFPLSPLDLGRALWAGLTGTPSGLPPATSAVLFQVRGPRVLAALLVGAGLAAAGTAFQGLFRNPLVSPDLLGASSGAALGAVVGILFGLPILGIEALSFAGGLGAVAVVYAIGEYQPSTAQATCQVCPAGKFGNATGLTGCYSCPAPSPARE